MLFKSCFILSLVAAQLDASWGHDESCGSDQHHVYSHGNHDHQGIKINIDVGRRHSGAHCPYPYLSVGGKCLSIPHGKFVFAIARSYCKTIGGHLYDPEDLQPVIKAIRIVQNPIYCMIAKAARSGVCLATGPDSLFCKCMGAVAYYVCEYSSTEFNKYEMALAELQEPEDLGMSICTGVKFIYSLICPGHTFCTCLDEVVNHFCDGSNSDDYRGNPVLSSGGRFSVFVGIRTDPEGKIMSLSGRKISKREFYHKHQGNCAILDEVTRELQMTDCHEPNNFVCELDAAMGTY